MKKQSLLGVTLTLIVPVCIGANPASIAYVDQQFSKIQTQIDAINNNPSGSTHYIGECYLGGVVYYVNTTPGAPAGQQGLVAALTDAPSGGAAAPYPWNTNASTGTFITPNSKFYFTGATNTAAILAAFTPAQAPAAQAAVTYPPAGEWYLPSQNELSTLYAQSTTSGGSFWTACGGTAPVAAPGPPSFYWSSTQQSISTAMRISFNDGSVFGSPIPNSFWVRPVRAF